MCLVMACLVGSMAIGAGCGARGDEASTAQRESFEDAVRAAAEARFGELEGLAGAVVGVRMGDAREIRFALGHVDLEKSEAMGLDRSFRIASGTKPFLGTVVLMLAEEGSIDLDAPIGRYLGEIAHGDAVTVRMLGNNSSGYFNAVADPAFRAAIVAEPWKVWSAEEILAFAMERPLTLEAPGEGWSYSNTNSVLLAEIVRVVTGEHWSAALERMVTVPLGLASVRMEEADVIAGMEVERGGVKQGAPLRGYRHATTTSAMEYGNRLIDATEFSPSWAGAAGSMRATAGDLLDAAEVVLSGAMLTEEMREELHGWIDTGYESSEGAHSQPAKIYYGFCIGKRRIGEREFIGHTGDVPGFSSFFAYEPESRMSIVVLSNLSNTARRLNPSEEIAEAVIGAIGVEVE